MFPNKLLLAKVEKFNHISHAFSHAILCLPKPATKPKSTLKTSRFYLPENEDAIGDIKELFVS